MRSVPLASTRLWKIPRQRARGSTPEGFLRALPSQRHPGGITFRRSAASGAHTCCDPLDAPVPLAGSSGLLAGHAMPSRLIMTGTATMPQFLRRWRTFWDSPNELSSSIPPRNKRSVVGRGRQEHWLAAFAKHSHESVAVAWAETKLQPKLSLLVHKRKGGTRCRIRKKDRTGTRRRTIM